MSLRISLLLSTFIHMLLLGVIPLPHRERIVKVVLPIEIIPYIHEPEVKEEKIEKKEVIREKNVIEKKKLEIKKKEVTEEETKKAEPPLIKFPSLSIEAAKFPFTYYLLQIKNKISENWHVVKTRGHYLTVVYFRINRDGKVEKLSLKKTSGDPSFDRYAIKAIEDSIPFPPLPAEYPENYLGVYFEFCFKE